MEQHEQPNNHGPIIYIRPDYTTKDYLELIRLDISDFEGKNVVSIGGGFGMLEMYLATNGTNVQIVDPIYKNKEEIQNKLEEHLRTFKYIAEIRKQYIEQTKQKLTKCLSDTQEQIEHLIKFYNKYINNDLPHTLKLNSSSGEDIKWIESNSQDYIFINNVLFHCPEKINNFLSEADKILKPGGTIFIIDYKDYLEDIQKYFKDNKTYNAIDKNSRRFGAFCGSIKKGEYKQVETFLENIQNNKSKKYTI